MPDYTVTAANVLASAYAIRFIPYPPFVLRGTPEIPVPNVCLAGAAITAGMPVYQDATTNLFHPADCNGADPLYKVVGIAENSAGIGQPVSIVVSDPQFTPGCTLAIGDIPIVSATPGGITESANKTTGWRVSPLGVAYSTTQMTLNITRSDVARA